MTQLERLQGIVARITYKPRWRIIVSRGPEATIYKPQYCEIVHILVQWKSDDILDPQKSILLMRAMSYSEIDLERYKDEDIIKHVIGSLIRDAELHEMDEWFKIDGMCVRDPHPELSQVKV